MRAWPALEIHHGDTATGEIVQAFLLDFGLLALSSDTPGVSCAFFEDADSRDRATAAMRNAFPQLVARALDVPDLDWAARSQASLRAVRVDDIVVAPPWDVPATSASLVIVIQPSMGFGTGHHATTRLCLAALQRQDLHGLGIIDVGTGSGVLAIAASRLGAASVVAIDGDPDAVASAAENLDLNPGVRVDLQIGDVRTAALGSFDVVIANLTGGLLIQAADRLRTLAGASGRLVMSGLMADEEEAVRRAYAGLGVARRDQEDEWVCLELAQNRLQG